MTANDARKLQTQSDNAATILDIEKRIVARVLELISEGYTSGFAPYWTITEEHPLYS